MHKDIKSKNTFLSKEEELQYMRDQLDLAHMLLLDADRQRSNFFASVSHELRTPLNSIIGYSNLMQKNKKNNLEPKQLGQLNKIRRNGDHLLKLIDDLVDLSKIEAGRMEVEAIEFNPNFMFSECVEIMYSLAENKATELTFETSLDNDFVLVSDEHKLRQIAINLISNAIRFVDTSTGKVIVNLSVDNDILILKVIDNGIGISEEKQAVIFDAYEQTDSSSIKNYGGTGLGLSIVKKMATMLGGDIEVFSIIDEGSVFRVSIPIT